MNPETNIVKSMLVSDPLTIPYEMQLSMIYGVAEERFVLSGYGIDEYLG